MLDSYVCWQHPFRNTQIYVHPQVVRSLSDHALESAKQGSEIGGALWGKVGPADSLIIADATVVPSNGPFFKAGTADARKLQQALCSRAPKATLSLAGYFRSSIRDGLSLTPQDQTLIRQCVRDPDAVFLVIKPNNNGICTAGLTFWEDGRLEMDASYLEIPFVALDEPVHRDASSSPETQASIRQSTVQSVEPPLPPTPRRSPVIPEPVHVSDEEPSIVAILRESAMRNSPPQNTAAPSTPEKRSPADDPQKHRTWALLLLGFASLCLVAAVIGTGIYLALPAFRSRLQVPPEQSPRPGLSFQVTRATDGQLNLNWNRSSPEVLGAPSALLTIRDGRRTNELQLDNAQLRAGKLMYFPKSDDVQFRLELNTDSLHTVGESVRVLSAAADSGHARRSRSGESGNQFVRGAYPTGPTESGEFPPSRTEVDVDVPTMRKSDSDSVPLLLPPRALPPVVTATTWSSTQPPSPRTTYVPPRVVEEMMPETTPVGQFARISVQVSIDRGGYVTAAHALKEEGTINTTLEAIATAAAQRWRFEPATLNGKPIPAEYRIVFAFHRQTPE